MVLQQAMNPWFAVQRASQVTMLLLAVAMLFIPVLTQPKQVEALEPTTTAIICACIAILGGLICTCLSNFIKRCAGYCGRWGVGSGHNRSCDNGHSYYSCDPGQPWLHAVCTVS